MTLAHEVAVAIETQNYFISPDGTPHDKRRIGELRNGTVISTSIMSDREIDAAGFPPWVRRGNPDANRLYNLPRENA